MASASYGGAAQPERGRTAYKLKNRFQWLNRFTDDELRDISVCYEGEPLKGDEHYFDLSQPEKGVMTGQSGQAVPDGSCYIAKSDVRPDAWHKLTTVS